MFKSRCGYYKWRFGNPRPITTHGASGTKEGLVNLNGFKGNDKKKDIRMA